MPPTVCATHGCPYIARAGDLCTGHRRAGFDAHLDVILDRADILQADQHTP